MEVIKQKQLLIDGVPAGKYGEWPGIKSNKWQGSIRILKPISRPNKEYSNILVILR